jgi:hypothetical protein
MRGGEPRGSGATTPRGKGGNYAEGGGGQLRQVLGPGSCTTKLFTGVINTEVY